MGERFSLPVTRFVTKGDVFMYQPDGDAGDPVYVRLNQHILDDVQRTTAQLQAQAPFATITRTDAIHHLIRRGAQADSNHP